MTDPVVSLKVIAEAFAAAEKRATPESSYVGQIYNPVMIALREVHHQIIKAAEIGQSGKVEEEAT